MRHTPDESASPLRKDELRLTDYPLVSARAARFERRLNGVREPTFADLIRQRKAACSSDQHGERLAMTIALIQAKPALDREVSGKRLQELSQAVGEDLLDAVITLDVGDLPQRPLVPTLPPISLLIQKGARLLSQVGDEPEISRLVQCACEIVQATYGAAGEKVGAS